jgi:hypothetical protein
MNTRLDPDATGLAALPRRSASLTVGWLFVLGLMVVACSVRAVKTAGAPAGVSQAGPAPTPTPIAGSQPVKPLRETFAIRGWPTTRRRLTVIRP